VRESHYVLTDVPMTFFVTLAMALALRAYEDGKTGTFAWAGAAAGLAAGTKYTAWVALLMPLIAAAWVAGPFVGRCRRALAALAAFFAAFLLVAPYTLIDLPGFLDGFAALAAAVPKRPASPEPGWLIYAKHLRIAMGWPAVIMGLVGLGWFVERSVRAQRRAPFVMVLVFLVVFWSMIIDRTLIFARYLMPALPLVCLLVGIAAVTVIDWLGKTKLPRVALAAVAVVLVASTLVQPAVSAITFDHQMGRRWTDSLALDWVIQNVKPGSRIVHDAASLHFPPGRFTIDYQRSLAAKDFAAYAGGGYDYLIASSSVYGRFFSDPTHFPTQYLAYSDLFKRLVPVMTLEPSADHPGPEIRIFSFPRTSPK
jgi:hypothetical protein